jgi:hypothetical protein
VKQALPVKQVLLEKQDPLEKLALPVKQVLLEKLALLV